jgi:hypothetical protein
MFQFEFRVKNFVGDFLRQTSPHATFGVGRVVVGSAIARRLAQAFEGGSSVKGFGRAGCVWWLVGGGGGSPPAPF